MNKVYFHSKNDEQRYLRNIYYMLFVFLLFGIYKNGITLYYNHLISILDLFKPLFLGLISVVISIGFSLLFKEKILSYRLISNLLVSLIVMPNISYLVFVIVLLVLNIIYHFIRFNIPAFFMVIVSAVSIIMHNYSYLNTYESSRTLQYGFLDYLFGKGMGGISNTFLLLTIICGIVLICNRQYKKHIVLSFLIGNLIFNIVKCFIAKEIVIGTFLNNNIIFGVIFISTISIHSTYTRGGSYLYGILLSILCFIASFFDINLGFYLAVCLLSSCSKLLDRPFIR